MSVLLLTIGFVVAALVARHNDVRLVASTRELRQSLALQEQVRTLVAPLLFAEAATAPRAPGVEAIPATAAAFRALDDVPRELERTRALVGAEPLAQANFERLASPNGAPSPRPATPPPAGGRGTPCSRIPAGGWAGPWRRARRR